LHEKLTELNDTFKKRSEQALLPPPPRLPSKDRGAEMQTSSGLESMRGTANLIDEEAEQTEKGREIGRL